MVCTFALSHLKLSFTRDLGQSRFSVRPQSTKVTRATKLRMCSNPVKVITRRSLLTIGGLATIIVTDIDWTLAQVGTRTVFDEERERYREQEEKIKEARLQGIRGGFDAVEKAIGQLDDIESFLNSKDWDSIQSFSRLFNDSVERELMEKIARKLSKPQKDNGLELSKTVTNNLIQIDRFARSQDGERVEQSVQQIRQAMNEFLQLRP